MSAVNATVRRAIVKGEENYTPSARQAVEENQDGASDGEGIYKTSPVRILMSASTVFVSVLIPTEKLYPLGNDGAQVDSRNRAGALRFTSELPRPVQQPLRGTKDAGSGRRNRSMERQSMSSCTRLQDLRRRGLLATSHREHLRVYALTPRGLSVGFPNGEFGAEACGRIAVTIPYATVRPQPGRSSFSRRTRAISAVSDSIISALTLVPFTRATASASSAKSSGSRTVVGFAMTS